MARSTRSRRTAAKDEEEAVQDPGTPVLEKRSRRGRKADTKEEEMKEAAADVVDEKQEEKVPSGESEPKTRRGRRKHESTPPVDVEEASPRKRGRSAKAVKEVVKDEHEDPTDAKKIQDKDTEAETEDTKSTNKEETKKEEVVTSKPDEAVVDKENEEKTPATKPETNSTPQQPTLEIEEEKLDFEVEDEIQFKAQKDADIEGDEKDQKNEVDEEKLSALDEMLKKRQSRRQVSTTDKENKKDRWGRLAEKESRTQAVVTTDSLKELSAELEAVNDLKRSKSVDESAEVTVPEPVEAPQQEPIVEVSLPVNRPKSTDADEELKQKRKARHISMGDDASTDKSVAETKTNNGDVNKKTPSAGIALGTTNWEDLEANRRKARDEATPPRQEATIYLLVNNLVRPFTLGQLTDFVAHGSERNVSDLWLDKIKSKAIATFETVEMSQKARDELHNVVWPKGSPKTIKCDFLTEEEVKNLKVGGPAPRSDPKENVVEPIKGGGGDHKEKESKVEEKENGKEEKGDLRKTLDGNLGKESKRGRSREKDEVVSPTKKIREWDLPKLTAKPQQEQEKPKEVVKENPQEPATLEAFFKKTTCMPPLYWLPLNEDEAVEKAKSREAKQKEEDRNKMKQIRNRRY